MAITKIALAICHMFLIEPNGAYWVGLVAAYAVFGKGMAKKSAPGAVAIQFLGGIAETCFPYCLMNPITILGPIAGNIFSIFVLTNFGGGAVGPPSPGSVFAFYMMTPRECIVVNTIAYFGSLAVSFVVTALILKLTDKSIEDAASTESTAAQGGTGTVLSVEGTQVLGHISQLNKVIFACDAGMGSSAMGVSILRTRLQKAGLMPDIDHVAVAEIPMDADVVVTNVNLAERAKMATKGKIPILTLSNFMDQNEYNRIVMQIKDMMGGPLPRASKPPLFDEQNIILSASFRNKRKAIEACADIFIRGGYTDASYKRDMIQRDEEASVYLGNGVAMPHGLAVSKETIRHSGICLIQVPEGVDFDGETAYVLIGVAGRGEEHVDILGHVGETLSDESRIEALIKAKTKQQGMEILRMDALKIGG